jgi:NAD(P)-dependent dehydrogenase (short-subunit alcohol dehydrogenase family)
MTTAPPYPPVSWQAGLVPDQRGRVAVVTGASSGLGAVLAETLAQAGATVVLGVRDPAKGERVRDGFGAGAAARVEVRRLELADLDSVARFAAEVTQAHPSVDLLVANAGAARTAQQRSQQGFDAVFATNHLGHFALTGRLLPVLVAAPAARVVSVGSNLYRRVRVTLPLDDLSADVPAARSYVASKLAVLLFATELDRRLRAAGSSVRSFAAHPGVADTPMQQQARGRAERTVARLMTQAIGRSARAGAIPLLYAATAPDAPTGVFLGPSLRKHDLRVHAALLVPPADDRALAGRLWAASEAATGVRFLSAPVRVAA